MCHVYVSVICKVSQKSFIKIRNIRRTATQQGGFHKLPKCSIGGHSFDLRNALLKRQISCGQTRRCPFCPLSYAFHACVSSNVSVGKCNCQTISFML